MLEFSSTESCSTGATSSPLSGFSSNVSSCDGNVALINDFESTGGCSSQGPQGPQGFSAYQIAVFDGFVGTEEEWLASLVGPGVPVGGTAGQILAKINSTNYNTQWINPPSLTGYVPYIGATQALNLGAFSLTANSIIKNGGTSSQYLMADGSTSLGFVLPSLNSGSVLFSNGTTIAQDNSNFFWDDTNNRLGIGTATPAFRLDVNGTSRIQGDLNIGLTGANSNLNFPNTTGSFANGFQSIFSGNALRMFVGSAFVQLDGSASIALNGNTTVSGINGNPALIINQTNNAWTTLTDLRGQNVTRFRFLTNGNLLIGTTTDNNGRLQIAAPGAASTDIALRIRNSGDTADLMNFAGNGFMGIGVATPAYLLDVNGTINSTISRIQGVVLALNSQGGGTISSTNSAGNNNGSWLNLNGPVYLNPATGNNGMFAINGQYFVQSGNSNFNHLTLSPIINATATYLGIIRGLFYNPTLTNIVGVTHRAIETVTGDVIFGSTSGNVGIGTTTPQQRLDISSASNYQGILVRGNAAPSVGFVQNAGTTPTWKIGISGNFGNNLAISSGAVATDVITFGANGVGIGIANSVSKLHIATAPVASANYGTESIGSGAFDGTTAGFFTGSASGTSIAVNEVSAFAGDLISLQVNGTNRLKISATGARLSTEANGLRILTNGTGVGGICLTGGSIISNNIVVANNGFRLVVENQTLGTGVTAFTMTTGTGMAIGTSGTQALFGMIGGFGATAGSSNYQGINLSYTLNSTGAQTGTATGIFLNATETALNGMVHNLLDLQVGGASKFQVTRTGSMESLGYAIGGQRFRFNNGILNSSIGYIGGISNGVIMLSNAAESDFGRLQLGGTTNLFPAIKRNGAAIDFKLADDSGFCDIRGKAINGNSIVCLSAGGVGISQISNLTTYGFHMSRNFVVSWGSNTQIDGSLDTAIARYSANVVRISNASTGGGNLFIGASTGYNASAVLQADSTTQGFLPPRMTNAERLAILTPAVGLMVYCTDVVEGLYINKSSGWAFVV